MISSEDEGQSLRQHCASIPYLRLSASPILKSLLETIADIVRPRYQFRLEIPLNIVFSDNFPVDEDPLASFRHRLSEMLGTQELKVYLDGFVGLSPGIDEAVVPEVSPGSVSYNGR